MPEFCGRYMYLTTHEFKNKISQWTQMLECGAYIGIFITRHGVPVGFYMTAGVRRVEEDVRKKNGPRTKSPLEQGDARF